MDRFQEAARERADHAKNLRNEYLATVIPDGVAEALYDYAWQEGHAHGFSEVESHYADLASLVEKAYRAGGGHESR